MTQELTQRIIDFRSFHFRLKQRVDYEQSTIVRLKDKISLIESEVSDLRRALGVIDRCIEAVSANGIGKIESIVTAGLQQVFKDEEPVSFVVEKKEHANGAQYRLLCRQGATIGNPMVSFGGGIQNVCAFLLRLIMCKRFKLSKTLILDESFNNINGAANQSRVSQMLQTLANDFGFTILAITGQKRLAEAATRIYKATPGPTLTLKTYEGITEEADLEEQIT